MTVKLRPALLLLAALAPLSVGPAGADPATGPFTVVESGRRFAHLQEAVNAIADGAGTIHLAPGTYRECAVQERGDISYLAATAGSTTLSAAACEGKAALVLRGRAARIEGLVFAGLRVPDGNGAGIRLERGNLTVVHSWFRDSQQGILTADDPAGSIAVDKSTFTRLGTCEGSGGCAHSLYVGDYGALSVTRSRFEAGRGGHYLKSRAATIRVSRCSFDDSAGQGTNYMIDLPAGASGEIVGNWFVQGRDKENYSAFIAIAAEGPVRSSADLAIAHNDARFVPGLSRSSAFVAAWSGQRAALGANTLAPGLTRFDPR